MDIDERTIIKRQYAAFFIALIMFIPSLLFFGTIFHNAKYGMIVPLVIMIYIGVSSVINRISIIRPKGRINHSTGKQAVIYGVITLAGLIANIIFLFTPFTDILFSWLNY